MKKENKKLSNSKTNETSIWEEIDKEIIGFVYELDQTSNCEDIAIKAHDGQFRRDGVTPYINHVNSVASRFDPNKEWKEYCVSKLHDVVEDSDYTIADLITLGIDMEVIEAVRLLTKTKGQDYFEYVTLIKTNDIARKVKLADIFANLFDTPTQEQVNKYLVALKILLI